MYYPSSKNKGADQLRGYREADLRLCFRICRLLVFPQGSSFHECWSVFVISEKSTDYYVFVNMLKYTTCFKIKTVGHLFLYHEHIDWFVCLFYNQCALLKISGHLML